MTALRIDSTNRRIRARIGTATVADSIDAKLLYRAGRPPEYFLPADDIDWDVLGELDGEQDEAGLGTHRAVTAPDGTAVGKRYVGGAAAGLVHIDFDSMDAWFEEDEQIYAHPRDPYRRVDVLESSRHVEVTIDGVTVASTDRPRLVDETGLTPRWYIPRADVDWSALEASDTATYCQYKGTADYWSFTPPEGSPVANVAWGYERPVPEAPKLAGLVAFYAELDSVETIVDGEVLAKRAYDPSMASPSMHLVNTHD